MEDARANAPAWRGSSLTLGNSMKRSPKAKAQICEILGLSLLLGAALWQVFISDPVSRQREQHKYLDALGVQYFTALSIGDLSAVVAEPSSAAKRQKTDELVKRIGETVERYIESDRQDEKSYGGLTANMTRFRMAMFFLGSCLLIYAKIQLFRSEKA